jgi:hypothetical protein
MHMFSELVDRSTHFTLSTLNEVQDRIIKALETSSATPLLKNLQMISLQKTILAVGILSIFESMLQDGLQCRDGFREADAILIQEGETVLKEKFSDYRMAINVLKHGRGPSYDALVGRAASLPFKIKQPDETFFCEGDVSEIFTLIEVDDAFVQTCAKLVEDVSAVVQRARPNYLL